MRLCASTLAAMVAAAAILLLAPAVRAAVADEDGDATRGANGRTGATVLPPHLRAARLRTDAAAHPSALTTADIYNTTVQIKTSDGAALLNTYVFLPSAQPESKIPAIMERTPYGAAKLGAAAAGWVARGYACVFQDFRGRFFSTGNFSFWRDGASDAADTIAWITSQPWSNGKVSTMGASADGIAQYVQGVQPQPHISSQFVIVATSQLHRTVFQQGAYRQSLISGWLTAIGEGGYAAEVMSQEGWADGYWGPTEMTTHYSNVQWPAVAVGGWWDIFQQDNLDAFDGYRFQANPAVRSHQYFVMLPTGHCGGGAITWPNKTWGLTYATTLANAVADAASDPVPPASVGAPARTAADMLPWGTLDAAPKLVWYVMGPGEALTTGNYWTSGDNWPPATPTKYFLGGKGKLQTTPAGAVVPSVFVYDPALPIPTVGGGNLLLPKCGPQDQSSVEDRFDVLKFTSDALVSSVAVTGKIAVTLFVSSNVTDTDFVVKVTDVFPASTKSMLVQDGIVRMRWRDGPMAQSPSLMTPGTVYNVTVSLGPTSYVFNPLHRIRVTVASSNFPRFSANPNNGKPLVGGGDSVTAVQTVWHDVIHQSHLELPVVSLGDMPEI